MIRRSLLLVALCAVSACSATDTTEAGIALVAGTYQLVSVNDQPVPFVEVSTGTVVTLTGSQLITRNDGTFTETSTRTTTTAGTTTTATVSTSGTYSVGGSVVVFVSTGNGPSGLGSYNGGSSTPVLTVPVSSKSYIYRKQ